MKTFSHLHGRGISGLAPRSSRYCCACWLRRAALSALMRVSTTSIPMISMTDIIVATIKSTIKSTTKNIRSIKSIIITTTDCSLSSCTMRGEAVPRADVCGTASSLFI